MMRAPVAPRVAHLVVGPGRDRNSAMRTFSILPALLALQLFAPAHAAQTWIGVEVLADELTYRQGGDPAIALAVGWRQDRARLWNGALDWDLSLTLREGRYGAGVADLAENGAGREHPFARHALRQGIRWEMRNLPLQFRLGYSIDYVSTDLEGETVGRIGTSVFTSVGAEWRNGACLEFLADTDLNLSLLFSVPLGER